MDKKSWIYDNNDYNVYNCDNYDYNKKPFNRVLDRIIIVATIIFFLLLGILVAMVIENDKVKAFEISTEEITEKSTTNLSSSFPITPSKNDLLFTNSATTITKETSSSSNSSFSSASAIAFYYNDNESIHITEEEYYIICGVVMNETGCGSYEGCVAVAQSIRNQMIREKSKGNPYDIASIRKTYQEHYTKTPNDLVCEAVADVFYNHVVVTKEPIIAWCNGFSSWHSQQCYICSYDGNDFYSLANKDW